MNYKYITTTKAIGGRIKQIPQDFIVEEIGDNYSTSVKYLPDKKIEELDWKTVFENKKEGQDFLLVDLEKINTSTTSAISQMSRFLRLSKKRISYAGLKDKRAITSQRISLYQPTIDQISKFYYKNIKIYNPIWSDDKINIGDLKQNKFTIIIRKVCGDVQDLQDIVSNFINQVNEKSIINYFGEQRFGGLRQITHRVGKLFLERNYKEAIILYLTKSFDQENDDLKQARKELKTDLNFRKHAAHFPARNGYENAMLNYLANNDTDFLGAIKVLPKSIQFLFIHAYQSYLFNELINLRLENKIGLDKIVGDNVINNNIVLPLFGFNSSYTSGKGGELERQLFSKENIDFDIFKNPDYSVLSSKGDFRNIKTKIYELKLLDISSDELNIDENKDFKTIKISFILDKGQYATNVVRELIKPINLDWY
jgi:tRNA pseudouridine13 synthase